MRASPRTAFLWQAASVACLSFIIPSIAFAQQKGFRPLPRYAQTAVPDQEEGRRILAQFRALSEAGEGFFTFDFRILPRRGEERRVQGLLWRGTDGTAPATRIVLQPEAVATEQRWLVRGGRQAGLWTWRAAEPDRVDPLPEPALFEPLAGTDVTAFDLQMPFLYWDDHVFEGVMRVRGRTTRVFLLYPPDGFAERNPGLTAVRVYLDLEYGAMVQAEQLDANGRPAKGMTVIDLKKIGDRWIVKSIDLRNERTRDKTRFVVTGAAVDTEFAAGVFLPEALADPLSPPARVMPVFP